MGKSKKKCVIDEARERLLRRRSDLRLGLVGELRVLKEERGVPPGDMVDAALCSSDDEVSSQLAEAQSREIERVENALERHRNGNGSKCEGCGNKIPQKRLKALPSATLCVKCQELVEQEGLVGTALTKEDWARLLEMSDEDDVVGVGSDRRH
jgi:DnaK suppressor protein